MFLNIGQINVMYTVSVVVEISMNMDVHYKQDLQLKVSPVILLSGSLQALVVLDYRGGVIV